MQWLIQLLKRHRSGAAPRPTAISDRNLYGYPLMPESHRK